MLLVDLFLFNRDGVFCGQILEYQVARLVTLLGPSLVTLVNPAGIGDHSHQGVSFLDLAVGPEQFFDNTLSGERRTDSSQVRSHTATVTTYLVAGSAGNGLEKEASTLGTARLPGFLDQLLHVGLVVIRSLVCRAHSPIENDHECLVRTTHGKKCCQELPGDSGFQFVDLQGSSQGLGATGSIQERG